MWTSFCGPPPPVERGRDVCGCVCGGGVCVCGRCVCVGRVLNVRKSVDTYMWGNEGS